MNEIIRIYSLCGDGLFDNNIRLGIDNENLKKEFRRYVEKLIVGIVEEEKDENKLVEKFKEILDFDKIKTEENYLKDLFWFSHNGITIYSKEDIITKGDNLELSPKSLDVINGAQTITNFSRVLNDIEDSLYEKDGYEDIEKAWMDLREKVLKKILIKTIFIWKDKDGKYIEYITKGLNNQRETKIEERQTSREETDTYNKILKKYNIEIKKSGDKRGNNICITKTDFIKLYLITKGKPGESKNFNTKKNIVEYYESLRGEFKEEDAKNISNVLHIGELWNEYVKKYKIDGNTDIIYKYGKNYFQSYFIKNMSDKDIDTQFDYMMIEFMNVLEKETIDVNSFKNDSLWDKINPEECESEEECKSEEECESIFKLNELEGYLNEKFKNNTKNFIPSINIAKFNKENKIELSSFRVISCIDSEDDFKVKEAFPFKNSTFSELYQEYETTVARENRIYIKAKDSNFDYEESEFKKAIEEDRFIYVIYFKDKDLSNISKINIIRNLNFKKYEKNAKVVFNRVKKHL